MPFAQPGQRIVWQGGRRVVVGSVSSGGGGGKTYAEFQAHIAVLAPTTRNWSANSTGWGRRRTTAAAATGSMVGSSWLGSFSGATICTPCRVVQHGLPSEAEFNAQISAGREIYIEVVAGDDVGYPSLNRNGYTSVSGLDDGSPDKCVMLIYWDGAQAQQMNPSTGTGPTPYTW